jgi:hypothetical protein
VEASSRFKPTVDVDGDALDRPITGAREDCALELRAEVRAAQDLLQGLGHRDRLDGRAGGGDAREEHEHGQQDGDAENASLHAAIMDLFRVRAKLRASLRD